MTSLVRGRHRRDAFHSLDSIYYGWGPRPLSFGIWITHFPAAVQMQSLVASSYPLRTTSDEDIQKLCQVLWDWKDCTCQKGKPCRPLDCPWKRRYRLQKYFGFYRRTTADYVPSMLKSKDFYALRNHQDLRNIVKHLRNAPRTPRFELMSDIFGEKQRGRTVPDVKDQHRAMNLATRVLFLIHCTSEVPVSGDLEMGAQSIVWADQATLYEYLDEAFPLSGMDEKAQKGIFGELSARRLVKVAGLQLQPTDDLREHLYVDEKAGTVKIFDQIVFLKECLLAWDKCPTDRNSIDR